MKPKTPEEIQEAHDFLHSVIEFNNEIPKGEGLPPDVYASMHAAHDALGWMLGCKCGDAFTQNITELRTNLEAAGFKLVKYSSTAE